jgi:ABC-type antimicrobial peptide transport system permease subunit
MARALWPGRDGLDECLRVSSPAAPCARVVGVVSDVNRSGLREQASLQYYLPVDQQDMFGGATLVIRPAQSPPLSWPAIRSAILNAHPAVRSVEVQLLRDALEGEVRPLRLGLVTFGMSGGLALVVAVLGLYSVMAYMVAWRTRELGVRVALGATDLQITRLVIGSGFGLAALGVAAGLALSLIAGRWLQRHLFETSTFDPLVVGVVAGLLLAVALLAGWIPARRAARISPTEALRAE